MLNFEHFIIFVRQGLSIFAKLMPGGNLEIKLSLAEYFINFQKESSL